MSPRKKAEPRQTTFLKSIPQVKNGDILDVDEAAALLKVSKKTIYTRVKNNAIPYAKLGRKLLFHRKPWRNGLQTAVTGRSAPVTITASN